MMCDPKKVSSLIFHWRVRIAREQLCRFNPTPNLVGSFLPTKKCRFLSHLSLEMKKSFCKTTDVEEQEQKS